MSDLLFNRDWEVTINGLIIPKPMHVAFKVEKSTGKEPNKMDLTVSNLSATSRGKLTAKGMAVTLSAGYENTSSVIFSGQSRICDSIRDGATWNTKIQCGDGETQYQFVRFSKSYAAGVSLTDVCIDLSGSLSINPGNLNAALIAVNASSVIFNHGYTAQGSAFSSLAGLLKSAGLTFSIQQGALLVQEKNKPAIQEVVILSAATGLLGSPVHSPPSKTKKQTTLTCRSLMNPKIRPGVILRLDSLNVKGDFIPDKVEHEGDSHGEAWETKVEATASTQKVTNV